jgi:hypothetical protein
VRTPPEVLSTSTVPDKEALVIPLEAGSVTEAIVLSDLVKDRTFPEMETAVKATGSASTIAAI